MIYGLLIPALWAAWFLYWGVAGIRVKPAIRRETRLSRAAHMAPLFLAVALLAYRQPWRGLLTTRFLPMSFTAYWVGVLLVVSGLGFAIAARRTLGGNWSGTVTVKQDHALIRTGPYALVRHPIYTGILLGFAGSAIALGEVRGLVAVLLATAAFLLKIRTEERWMTERFGDAYLRYREEVKALIPFLM